MTRPSRPGGLNPANSRLVSLQTKIARLSQRLRPYAWLWPPVAFSAGVASFFLVDRQQWLGVDATHKSLVQGNHCRLAVAKDFTGASPIRGIRTGGGQETLDVQVTIERVG